MVELGPEVDETDWEEMEKATGKADYLIKESGCGLFQVLIFIFVDLMVRIGMAYSTIFMAFGNYNPGWRCLDNNTLTLDSPADSLRSVNTSNGTSDDFAKDDESEKYYINGSCELFVKCENIEYNPESSTLVTEWDLLCHKSWVPSLIISVQMAGIFVGSIIAGQLGDTFGRKKILYCALATLGVLNIGSMFARCWQVFAVIRFIMGGMAACLYNSYNTLPMEYLNSKWRVRQGSSPVWTFGGVCFGIAAMLCKDWRDLHLIGGIYCILACMPSVWVPESLRWLEVKGKSAEFEIVAKKLIRLNKVPIVSLESCDKFIIRNHDKSGNESEVRHYTIFDLFRKDYALYTSIFGFMFISAHVSYFAISFGISAMYGNFYVNLLLLFVAEIPYSLVPMFIPNLIGRKKGSMFFITIVAGSLLTAAGFILWAPSSIKDSGVLILALVAKMNISASLSLYILLATELYPTVVRVNAIGYCNSMGRIGGIISPLLVPTNSQDLDLSFAILGTMCLLCSILLTRLPETKGKDLKEVFEQS